MDKCKDQSEHGTGTDTGTGNTYIVVSIVHENVDGSLRLPKSPCNVNNSRPDFNRATPESHICDDSIDTLFPSDCFVVRISNVLKKAASELGTLEKNVDEFTCRHKPPYNLRSIHGEYYEKNVIEALSHVPLNMMTVPNINGFIFSETTCSTRIIPLLLHLQDRDGYGYESQLQIPSPHLSEPPYLPSQVISNKIDCNIVKDFRNITRFPSSSPSLPLPFCRQAPPDDKNTSLQDDRVAVHPRHVHFMPSPSQTQTIDDSNMFPETRPIDQMEFYPSCPETQIISQPQPLSESLTENNDNIEPTHPMSCQMEQCEIERDRNDDESEKKVETQEDEDDQTEPSRSPSPPQSLYRLSMAAVMRGRKYN